jgi:parvulin-like peptidyl-prolyl isomerase
LSSSPTTTNEIAAKAAPTKGSGTTVKIVILLAVVVGIGAALTAWKVMHGGAGGFDRITKAEMEALIKDANPMILKRMAEDPQAKEQQLESLKELMSLASAAYKEFGSDPVNQRALEFIDTVTLARLYDREKHKDAGQMPPFGFITEDQIKAFYGEGQAEGSVISTGEKNMREQLFKQFVDTQLELAKRTGNVQNEVKPSDEEIAELKKEFAKVKIYEAEAREKMVAEPDTWKDFSAKASVQAKLQKANFLARLYQESLAEKAAVTDEEVQKYLADNPTLVNTAEKKAKAEEIVKRLGAGEDFAAIAKELSEDPGSKNNGGLYENVTEGGGFDPKFEAAALALEPGQYTQAPVETQFGYHIIKLEKKNEAKGADGNIKQTYDVRHILLSTQVTDPENPMGRPMPAEQYARVKLQDDKEKAVLEAVKQKNPVVIEDFEIPTVSDTQIEDLMKQQMPPAAPEPEPTPKAETGKPKKKK